MKAKFRDVEVEGTPEEIAAFVTALQKGPSDPPAYIPFFQLLDPCPAGGQHEYPPTPWWQSTTVPTCSKCHTMACWPLTYQDFPIYQTNPMPPCRTTTVRPFVALPTVTVSQLPDQPAPQGCTD